MRRHQAPTEYDVLDVLRARVALKRWTGSATDDESKFRALDVIAALRALTRDLDDNEQKCLELAAEAGV